MEEKGFWVRYWYSRGHSDTKIDSYHFYPYSHGWTQKDKDNEEAWRKEAESWAEDKGCWSASSFRYGFEMVDKPPKEWIESRIKEHESSLNFYKQFLEE